jgi:hypothetical protein
MQTVNFECNIYANAYICECIYMPMQYMPMQYIYANAIYANALYFECKQ